jgi:outer membrane lipoprotein-sorting protein
MKQILFLLVAFSFLSCNKGNTGVKPVIDLVSPSDNQQFTAGQVVNITGTVSDTEGIHEVHVYVINVTNSAEVLHFMDHIDAATYNINQHFTAVAATNYKVRVEATNHSGYTTVVEIFVKGI